MVGIGAGVAYALARREIGWTDKGQPWQAHGRGVAGHLAFDLAAETVLDIFDAVA